MLSIFVFEKGGILLFALVFAIVVALADAQCPEVCLDVSQGSRYYGRFPPLSTPASVKHFYHYKHYSFNGDDTVPLLIDQSLLLIHYFNGYSNGKTDDGPKPCDLSLVIVHDSKDDSTGGQVRMFATGNHEDALVQDGPGDGSKSDRYMYMGAEADKTELFWEWGWQESLEKKIPDGRDSRYLGFRCP